MKQQSALRFNIFSYCEGWSPLAAETEILPLLINQMSQKCGMVDKRHETYILNTNKSKSAFNITYSLWSLIALADLFIGLTYLAWDSCIQDSSHALMPFGRNLKYWVEI